MVGKGSVNHNSRVFKAENVDGERTEQNINYFNDNIREVYHKLFDEALERYNARQKRADRRIDDYYEKIRTSKQEKLFHELILQIGNKDDMDAQTDNGQLAKVILDEYFQGFQQRNPNLRVFSAHLHMDEATPHLHIDFVPFTTGSKRGLDTRVSLKQALAAQGFTGGTRQDTEWNQWVQSEKEHLAAIMACHGIEWEQKGTHEQHLSVLDYEKKVRAEEVAELGAEIAEKRIELTTLERQIGNYLDGVIELKKWQETLETALEYQLPEPQGLMTAKTYRTRYAMPVVLKLKQVIETLVRRCIEAWNAYHRLNTANGKLYQENDYLRAENDRLTSDITYLTGRLKDYKQLHKIFGREHMDGMLEQARQAQKNKRNKAR